MRKLVSLDDTELNVSAVDWQDAIIRSRTILLNNDYVTREYVNAIVQTVKNLGPYIMMVPGLAVPRARSINGVIKNGISIMTLSQPVEFDNENNDPVYLLIGLTGSNDDLHLKIMQAIATIFEDGRMLERITACGRREMVTRVFSGVGVEEQCYILLRFVNAARGAA